MTRRCVSFFGLLAWAALAVACTASGGPRADGDVDVDGDADLDADAAGDAIGEDTAADDPGPDTAPATCGFDYDAIFTYSLSAEAIGPPREIPAPAATGRVAHVEPPPPHTFLLEPVERLEGEDLVMPGYTDTMPLFERAVEWTTERRCWETPDGAALLTEAEAYDLYRRVAELTTGVAVDTTPGARTVVGLRGAYPGTFAWHGNLPDRFNDTLALLWIDDGGVHHVREFPVNTDVGARDFGPNSSSSLRPNMRYLYDNSWHRTYNALHIDIDGYRVRDDTNNNGHWDSDRNGWLPPTGIDDYDRTGGGHNIHMGSVDGPLGSAVVGAWSAGCQVIPGMANWTEFITHAWTGLYDPVNYFLIDVRDIAPEVWHPCTPDGTHDCPWHIDALPFVASGDTRESLADAFDVYNCSGESESGAEDVYVLTLDASGTLTATVECEDPVVDVDVHLLDGDDPNACLTRDHWSLTWDITPGRYLVIVDTWVDGAVEYPGPYTLTVTFE